MNKTPIKVNYLKLSIFSSLVSGFLTLSILFIYIRIKNRFRDVEDVRSFINLPCLGSVPELSINEISEIKNIKNLNDSIVDKKSKLLIFQKWWRQQRP